MLMQSCWLLQVDALLARDSHNAKQLEVLRAELNRLRGSNRTETLAAMHDVALQEVRPAGLASTCCCLHVQIAGLHNLL